MRRNGGKLYYGRMMMAHVYEALHIIEEIKGSVQLRAAVDRCDSKTGASFNAVAKFLDTDDYKVLSRIRHNSSFHYDPKLTLRALEKAFFLGSHFKSGMEIPQCSSLLPYLDVLASW